MCEYCDGKNPIVDMGDDNLGTDGRVSIKIEYIGARPFITSEHKKNEHSIDFCNVSSDRKKEWLVMRWGRTINYCPMCGKKLI